MERPASHLLPTTFSPINENGSFACDRVLKAGQVHKRTRKTKQWKPFFLVLRPNLLSLYRSSTEDRLLKQIILTDLTAVTHLRDPKGRRDCLFGLYSPARNWHLQADSESSAKAWVDLVRGETSLDEDHEADDIDLEGATNREARTLGSSSPEPQLPMQPLPIIIRNGIPIPSPATTPNIHSTSAAYSALGSPVSPGVRRTSFQAQAGTSLTSDPGYSSSDFSDAHHLPYSTSRRLSHISHPHPYSPSGVTAVATANTSVATNTAQPTKPLTDLARVLIQGRLSLLWRSPAPRPRHWKRTWAVLRPSSLSLYKDESEYSALLILPLESVISAVEIDPVSKTRTHCMQIIAEDRSYRLCAQTEDDLVRWLAGFGSCLERRKLMR